MIPNLLQKSASGSWTIPSDSLIEQIEGLVQTHVDKCTSVFQQMVEKRGVDSKDKDLSDRLKLLTESLCPFRQVAMEEIYRTAFINQLAGIAAAIKQLESQAPLETELQELSQAIGEATPPSISNPLDATDSTGGHLLHWASFKGHTELAKFLIDRGAAIDQADNKASQPIHWAVSGGHSDVVELLLDKGAAANAEDCLGRQPLHLAVIKGHVNVARLLLSRGANLDGTDLEGKRPLDWALFLNSNQLVRLFNLEPLFKSYRNRGYLTRFLDPKKPFPIEKSYINITLVNHNEFEEVTNRGPQASRDTRLQVKEVKLPELFDGNTHLYIEGAAGSGKTTLCRYLVSTWAHLSSEKRQETLGPWANQFEAILLLPLREIRSLSKAATLNDFIHQRYPALSIDLFAPSKTLYILDGFDEIASLEEICQSKNEDRRWEIVEALLQQSHWIITSRPNLFSERFFGCRLLHNSGFTSENVTAYIRCFCRDFKMQSQGLENAVRSSRELEVLAHNPLYLELICSLWKENPGVLHSLHNLSTLYDKIVTLLFRRHLMRVGINTAGLFQKEVLAYEKVRPYRECLEEIAFHSKQMGGNRIIPDLYQPLLERIPLEEREAFGKSLFDKLGLLTPVGDAKELFEQNYAFIHLTFEEYFAARYFVSRLESAMPLFGTVSAADWLKENCFSKNFEKLIDFTASLAVSDRQLHPLANALLSERAHANAWGYPLHRAAEMGLLKLADLFLSMGAKIDAVDKYGEQPLRKAAQNGHKELVELFLSKGSKIDATDDFGRQSLHAAGWNGHKEVVELLLQMGAKVDATDKDGKQPLHWAAQYGHKEVVELLLQKGAKVDATYKDGKQPLHWAANSGHKEVVELLLQKGAKVDASDKKGKQPLHLAAENGHKEVVELLLQKGAKVDATDKEGKQPLHLAAQYGKKEVVELLLSNGAKIDAADKEKMQPLHLAAQRGHKEVVELLLQKGAKVNAAKNDGRQPLHLAAEDGHKEVVELLLSDGAKIDAADIYGALPLHWAADNGHKEVVNLLLSKGAKIDLATSAKLAEALRRKEVFGSINEVFGSINIEEAKANTAHKSDMHPQFEAALNVYNELVKLRLILNADGNCYRALVHLISQDKA